MIRALVVLSGMVWAVMSFVMVSYLRFPGDAVSERVEYEVTSGSGGDYALDLGDLSPWWLGLSTDSAKLYGKPDKEGNSPLLVLATDARAAVSPFSLLRRAPSVSGSVTLGLDGTLYYGVSTGTVGKSGLGVTEISLDSESFPIAELLALIPNAEMNGTGDIHLNLSMKAPEGLSKADGKINLGGRGLTLIKPVIMDFPLGRDVILDDIDLRLDAKKGKAKIVKGKIQSDIANIEITGEMTLSDVIGNSRIDLHLEVELDESMSAMKAMMKKAEKNGKLIFTCKGRLASIDRACKAGDGKSAQVGRRGRSARPTPPSRKDRPAKLDTKGGGLSDEDRETRRKELQERLRKRREARRAKRRAKRGRGGSDGDPMAELEEDPPVEDDEELDDEEVDEPAPDDEDIEEE